MNTQEMQSVELSCEANPFGIPVEAPMPKRASKQLFHKPGAPDDWQGYGLGALG